ncbi:hypothetical protein KBD81_05550 [Candidatus Woesebacteria bacterium]|nr:hypothetical protein [Candidatus Woesebacteria bacterium]
MTDDQNKAQSNSHTSIAHLMKPDETNDDSLQGASYSKEGEPMRVERSESDSQPEEITSETEPDIESKELKEFIEVQNDEPTIHPDLKKAGLQAIETSSLDPKHRVKLPISDDQVMEGLQKPLSSSFRWLAELALFMLRRAHLNLKKLHGHVVRVIQR